MPSLRRDKRNADEHVPKHSASRSSSADGSGAAAADGAGAGAADERPVPKTNCAKCGQPSERAICEACRDALQELHSLSL
jgi:hypothetical protein